MRTQPGNSVGRAQKIRKMLNNVNNVVVCDTSIVTTGASKMPNLMATGWPTVIPGQESIPSSVLVRIALQRAASSGSYDWDSLKTLVEVVEETEDVDSVLEAVKLYMSDPQANYATGVRMSSSFIHWNRNMRDTYTYIYLPRRFLRRRCGCWTRW